MPDREKVIKGLEHCKKYGSLGGNDCNGHYEYTDNLQEIIKANNYRKDCLYGQCRTGCVVTLVGDALSLLKEQEAVEPEKFMDGLVQRYKCRKCGKYLLYARFGKDNYCSKCGQAVKWE